MRLKKKEKLTAYWDKKENCIGAYHPLGFMTQTDAHYLFDNVFTKEFVKEMTDRGYDVTTMKFEISPKLPNYERFNGLSKKYCRKEKQRMKKQIVLDEQDIKEFHEDAEHLRWLYNRMVCEYGESVNFDYMHRFAKIFNKLKQLQRMKIRLAKKIMKHKCTFLDLEEKYKKKGYNVKWLLAWASYDKRKMCRNALPFDHRITKAISLTSKKK